MFWNGITCIFVFESDENFSILMHALWKKSGNMLLVPGNEIMAQHEALYIDRIPQVVC